MRRLAAVLTLAAALAAPGAAHAQEPERTLGVQGLGEVELAPDVGTFEAVVRRTAATSAAARGSANVRLVSIVGRLRAIGVPRTDITTTSVSLFRERYRLRKGGPLKVRYTASGAFAVRVQDVEQVGRALDVAADAGATGIDGPRFSFSQARRTEGRLAAERAALADARRRADEAAASQGQRVTGVRSIELDPGSAPGPQPVDSAGQEASVSAAAPSRPVAPTPVLPGRETFSSTVRVVYVLQPA